MKKKLATVMAATMAVSGSVVSVNAATTDEQLIGSNRTDTAVKISKEGWYSADTVILVNDAAIPDALTATPLAHAKNAPILLTGKGGLTKATADEIKRLGAKDVIMIGGDTVLPKKIENDLKAINVKADRVKGATREETALAIAKRLDGIKDVSEIAVVNSTTGLADAVSVAAAAAEKGMPIILANPTKGLSAAEKFIKDEAIKSSFVIGGKTALPEKLVESLPAKQRIEGANRNDTNARVIEKFYGDKELDNLYLAKDGRGGDTQLIDALAVGALAAKNGAPVLIASKNLSASQTNVINTKKISIITQVGGKGNEGAFNQLKEIEKAEVIKVKNEAELQEALKKANANDTIEIDKDAFIAKDLTLSTNNAIKIDVKGDLLGKVTVKTPNADIKNSGTIGTLVVSNGKNTTVTNTSAGKISKVEVSSSSENVKVENNGTITEVKNDGEGTKVENDGTISKPITGTETPNVEGNKPGGSTGGGGGGSITPPADNSIKVSTSEELTTALTTAKAGDTIKITGNIGSESSYGVYNIKENNVTVTSDSNNAVYGSFVVTGENCVIKNITITNKGDKKQEDGTTPNTAVRNGINAACSKLTVTNCTFNNNNSENGIKNGLSIWPTNENVTYNISENTFIGFKTSVSGYASTAITIAGGVSKPQVIEGHGTSVLAKMTDEQDRAIINGNTFNDCKGDYCREDWTNGNKVYCKSISNGDNLLLANAADNAKYYVTESITRNDKDDKNDNDLKKTTVKAGTTLTIKDGASMTMAADRTLEVLGTVVGDVKGTDGTSKLIIGKDGLYKNLGEGTYLWMNGSWVKEGTNIIKNGELTLDESKKELSTSFTWSSSKKIGSDNEVSSNGYNYYTNGVYLRFQVKSNDVAKKFNEIFSTKDGVKHEQDHTCGMTLQTNDRDVNDMEGSNREKADWGDLIGGTEEEKTKYFNQYSTKLKNDDKNYIFYGVVQGKKISGTKTIGFEAGDSRNINMVLRPKADLADGTYTVTVELVQQGNESKSLGTIDYTFTVNADKTITVK